MSTFSAADEYPKLLHEFELAEQRIAKLEAELAEEKFMREITHTGLYGAEEELKEVKAERDGWEKAARECAGHCHDYCVNIVVVKAKRDKALEACRELNNVVRKDLICEVCLRRLSTAIPQAKAALDD